MTRADVLRVAKQYLNPANLTVVVAANPTMFGEPLERLGPVTKLDITIPEAKPEVLETTEASLAEGKQILLKAQAAAGGTEKLAAVKDYTMLAEYPIDPACGEHRRRKNHPDRQMDLAHDPSARTPPFPPAA